MARVINVPKPVTKEEERFERVTFSAMPDGSYSVNIGRQVLGRAANNEVISRRPAGIANARSLAPTESVTLAGGTAITVAQIAEAFDILSDRWATEDEAARNTPVTPTPQPTPIPANAPTDPGPPVEPGPPPRATTAAKAPAKTTRRRKT